MSYSAEPKTLASVSFRASEQNCIIYYDTAVGKESEKQNYIEAEHLN